MNQQVTLRALSPQDFRMLGVNDVAYVVKGHKEGKEIFEIHSADGTAITAMSNHDVAFAMVRQNGLEPLSVH
jgi:hypothetical protein